jgi:hypothetical protein
LLGLDLRLIRGKGAASPLFGGASNACDLLSYEPFSEISGAKGSDPKNFSGKFPTII